MSTYRFRPFLHADLPMASRWLRTPEVIRWWGEPERELALLTEDLDEPRLRQWIVECNGRPFAYLQDYLVATWPQPHYADLPEGSVSLDTFIGEPEMLGRGHGAAFLGQFARLRKSEGAPFVVIDPDANNHRARRAYARAGFVDDGIFPSAKGAVARMSFKPALAAAKSHHWDEANRAARWLRP